MAASGFKCSIIVLLDRGHPFTTRQLCSPAFLPEVLWVTSTSIDSCVPDSPGEFYEGDAGSYPNICTVKHFFLKLATMLNPPPFDVLECGAPVS